MRAASPGGQPPQTMASSAHTVLPAGTRTTPRPMPGRRCTMNIPWPPDRPAQCRVVVGAGGSPVGDLDAKQPLVVPDDPEFIPAPGTRRNLQRPRYADGLRPGRTSKKLGVAV
ncbi:hypothetical protein GCM10010449_12680 [Streptomyces rectiviolaceus]|uniref:Uncharacterized protein n=1 Tax=Streptomyces rectiviolaceus TaxID=332591 RepID=A0ABP6M915_9ACTN